MFVAVCSRVKKVYLSILEGNKMLFRKGIGYFGSFLVNQEGAVSRRTRIAVAVSLALLLACFSSSAQTQRPTTESAESVDANFDTIFNDFAAGRYESALGRCVAIDKGLEAGLCVAVLPAVLLLKGEEGLFKETMRKTCELDVNKVAFVTTVALLYGKSAQEKSGDEIAKQGLLRILLVGQSECGVNPLKVKEAIEEQEKLLKSR
jgi:hypothetical protein